MCPLEQRCKFVGWHESLIRKGLHTFDYRQWLSDVTRSLKATLKHISDGYPLFMIDNFMYPDYIVIGYWRMMLMGDINNFVQKVQNTRLTGVHYYFIATVTFTRPHHQQTFYIW